MTSLLETKTETKIVCHGHSCQGQIDGGYCSRHKYLKASDEPAGAGAASSAVKKSLTVDTGLASRSGSTLASLTSPKSAGGRSAPSLVQISNDQVRGTETLENFLQAVHAISSEIEPHKAAERIIQETCRLLDAERSTLFYVDGDELVLMIAKGAKNIRLPKTRGIAGHVASTGETVNIPDAHSEPKFDASHDNASGFRTRNILATPVCDAQGEVIAVLQSINKQHGGFSALDEVLIQNIAFHCSVVIRNAALYEAAKQAETKVSSLLEIIEMLHSDPNIHSLIFTLSQRAHSLVNADRSTLYLADHARNQLVVMQGDVDIRVPLNKGMAGLVAVTGHVLNVPDCYQDDRFNRTVDQKTGYRTKSMLCMPIFGDKSVAPVSAAGAGSKSGASGAAASPGLSISTTGGVLPGAPVSPVPTSGAAKERGRLRQRIERKDGSAPGSRSSSPGAAGSGAAGASGAGSAASSGSSSPVSGSPGVPSRSLGLTATASAGSKESAASASASASSSSGTEREIVGVLQLINKLDDSTFNETDERILSTLLKIAGPLLQRSSRAFFKSAPAGEKSSVMKEAVGMEKRTRSPGRAAKADRDFAQARSMKGISEADREHDN